jgi:flagellin
MASFSVVNNIASQNAQANLLGTQIGLQKALTRLSSGFRINSSGDDAAGLVTANQYRQDLAVLSQGVRNANDGLSDLQIKDGALANVATLLDRLSTLATQSASGSTTSRTSIQNEFTDVLNEINRESTVAGLSTAANFSVFISNDNAGSATDGKIAGTIAAVTTTSLGLASLSVASQAGAEAAVEAIATAVGTLGTSQAKIGTLQNQLQFAIGLAQSQVVNTRAAESRIRDANVAEESANMTRYNILTQSGIAALAQANQATSAVLSLLR